MNSMEKGLRAILARSQAGTRDPPVVNDVTAASLGLNNAGYYGGDETSAMKLSAVNRCIELLSDSLGKLPIYVFDSRTNERIRDHALTPLLTLRPNAWQTPFVAKKQLEASRLNGNGIAWIRRDPRTLQPVEFVPIPRGRFQIFLDSLGAVRYRIRHPYTDEAILCGRDDVLHVIAYTRNGYNGISVLERAEEVIRSGRAAQEYSESYYANGGQPSGILRTDSDLGGNVTVTDSDGTQRTISKKDRIREEWERRHSGPANAWRTAVLDMGLDYKPLAISNRDAQFVEQSEISVQDIARFFGVPLYKLGAGKQSYNSNEQNAIEYVVGTLHPIVTQYEQELTYKLLLPSEVEAGLQIRINMMAELRGDNASRSSWYQNMRNIGVFSVNDIRELEDQPDVEGGDERYASLNFVPLSDWKTLSAQRNAPGTGGREE